MSIVVASSRSGTGTGTAGTGPWAGREQSPVSMAGCRAEGSMERAGGGRAAADFLLIIHSGVVCSSSESDSEGIELCNLLVAGR